MPNITTVSLQESTRDALKEIKDQLEEERGARQSYDDTIQALVRNHRSAEDNQ